MRKYFLIGASAFVLGAGSMAYVSQQALASAQAPNVKTYKMLELFGDVLDTVERQYVTEVDDQKLIEAAIDGMLTSLDPHSGYLNPDSFDDMRDQARARGFTSVRIVCHPPALGFYRRMGAVQVGATEPTGRVTWARPILQLVP